MNKVFLGIILAVCVLGMILVMLNNRLGRKAEPRATPPVTQVTPATPAEIEANARAREIADAARALSAPEPERQPEREYGATLPEPLPREQPGAVPEAASPAPEASLLPPMPVNEPEQPARQERKPATPPKPEQKPAQQQAEEAPKTAQAEKPVAGATITRFVVFARTKGATVRIGGNAKLNYSSMNLENPDRIVVDITGPWKFPANPGVPKNDLVSAVRVGKSGDKTRVVIDLKQKPRKMQLVPFRNGDGVDVRLDL